ncbi:4Fe-4S dicluster domain-containing protein [bacterium]|nr:4Fe-4S dicluster domain-containing protein [bacterium]
MINEHRVHSLLIDEDKCIGCVVCTLACPAKAIRVKNNRAQIFKEELCIDCGECMRVCPEHAIQSTTLKPQDLTGYKKLVAVPSPVLYSQFDESITPNDVLLGLLNIGFDFVYDKALSNEKVSAAINIYLDKNTEIRPGISNYCPAVVRLILKNYPNLIDHVIPIEMPREIAAKRVRAEVVKRTGVKPEEVGVFHITPCAALMVSIREPVGVKKSTLDGAIAIRDIYTELTKAVKEVSDDWILQRSSGVGLSWVIGEGGVRGMPTKRCLTVSGVKEVIRVLDDLEAGRLTDVDYLDCSICPEGCVGGPLVVKNKFFAVSRIRNLIEQYGVRSRVNPRRVLEKYESHFLLKDLNFAQDSHHALDTDFHKALEKMNRIEEITNQLPGKKCGACGAPDCRTLAEDIVAGDAELTDCMFIKIKELTHELEKNH